MQTKTVDLDAFIVSERADTIFDACDATEVRTAQLTHRERVGY